MVSAVSYGGLLSEPPPEHQPEPQPDPSEGPTRVRTAIIALGRIGPPLAVQYADKSHGVVGADANPAVIEVVSAGTEPFPGEAHLARKLTVLSPVISNSVPRATTDCAETIPEADVIVLVVPLFVNDATWEPGFAWMSDTTRSLTAHLTPNIPISYETTLPVGTLRGRPRPMIEGISGLKEGADSHLVLSPERVLTDRVFTDLRRYPELMGGLGEVGTQAGIAFYESALDFDERDGLSRPDGVWDMGTAEAIEMAKFAETTYCDVNIGPANQFAAYIDKAGFGIKRVIKACNSQSYFHIHHPGIAMGGHCIPVCPCLYLSADPGASVAHTARTLNVTMSTYIADRATEVFGLLKSLCVIVLGVSYRGKAKEIAFSGVFPTVETLRGAGTEVFIHDPMCTDEELANFGWTPYHLGGQVDAVIVQAGHLKYGELSAADPPGLRLLLDGHRAADAIRWTGVPRLAIGGGE